jgi:endonuclease/exonuclease/phosphatase family metal-dependent hydrolase
MKIRVITFNIHKGFGASGLKYNLILIKKLLVKYSPDIVLIQEMHGLHPKNHSHLPSPLELLADEHWPFYNHGVNSVYSKNFHGNAILSKFPILKTNNLNISTNKLEKRGLLQAQLKINNSVLDIFCTHLNLLPKGQDVQINKILNFIKSESKTSNLILAGDFNDWTRSIKSKTLSSDLDLNSIPRFNTFPSYLPVLPLDGLYYRGLKMLQSGVIKEFRNYSDHLALFADLELVD